MKICQHEIRSFGDERLQEIQFFMMKKVIYVSYVRLSDKTARDHNIDHLIAKGVAVEFWDVVALLREEFYEFAAKTTDYLYTFKTFDEVEARLRLPENRDAYYVMLIPYDGHTAKIYHLLSKYDCKMLFKVWGAVPARSIHKWRKVLSGFPRPLWLAEKVFFKAKASVYRKLKLVKPYDIVFAAGRVSMMQNLYANKVIPINSADYDQYRKIKVENKRLMNGRYAVFLDVYLPYHTDYKVVGWQAVEPQHYYAVLNRFFDLLEMKFGIKVVIAAHPKADYSSVNPFGDRQIYQNQTAELVKDSDFVISHSSMSQSYAILNHKPIIFIYTDEMVDLLKYTYMCEIHDAAGFLDASIYNIDKISKSDQIIVKDVNARSYEDYKYNYLTAPESENTTAQETFWHAINIAKQEGFTD